MTLRDGIVALALVGAGIFVVSVWELARRRRGGFLEPHHAYWGLLLIAVPAHWRAWARAAWIAGLLLLYDDAIQHLVQIERPAYLSPVHRAYVLLARWLLRQSWCPAWLRSLVAH